MRDRAYIAYIVLSTTLAVVWAGAMVVIWGDHSQLVAFAAGVFVSIAVADAALRLHSLMEDEKEDEAQ